MLTLRLEDSLVGSLVTELRDRWQSTQSYRLPVVHVDLRSVIFVDAAGMKLLTDMYRHGAKLLVNDCQLKAAVAEIETAAVKCY